MNWQTRTEHGIEFTQSVLLNRDGLVQAFSTRGMGNLALHTGDRPEDVVLRRRRFLASLGLDFSRLVAANQVHGIKIKKMERQQEGAGAFDHQTAVQDTDAMMTNVPGMVLSIFTADCLPIFLFCPDTPAVAVIHAGWRVTIARIVEKTIEQMVLEYRTVPGRLLAAIGPAICAQCFQVNREVADLFGDADAASVITDSEGYRVDLAGFNTRLLTGVGLKAENISRSGLCTCCNPERFFSYRAENRTIGRMMGIISLKETN